MTVLKPFQTATVDAAVAALTRKRGRPRFLVADEVGLGKTVVAQHVIKKMAQHRRRPLVVYYVCSNLTIAAQNSRKLVEAVAPGDDAEAAICAADRLSLLPFEERPSHPKVHLFTLTPDTSLPGRKGRRRDGRKEERALLFHLIDACWPGLARKVRLKRSAVRHWHATKKEAGKKIQELKCARGLSYRDLEKQFKEKAREQFGVARNGPFHPAVEALLRQKEHLEVIGRFRNALVECSLEIAGLSPDLVIFDEFQRFRDLIQPDAWPSGFDSTDIDPLVRRLRGDGPGRVPLLLLSATPYSLYNRGAEAELFGEHYQQLYSLLCFLFGDGEEGRAAAEHIKSLFNRFGTLIHRPRLDSETLAALKLNKSDIESQLARVMSRTERAQGQWDNLAEESSQSPEPCRVEATQADWQVFRHFAGRLQPPDRFAAVPYWRSIPLPMQTMDGGYVAWQRSNIRRARLGKPPAFQSQDLQEHRPFDWPHGKLRELISTVTPELMCLPWLPPSAPWWQLDKRWDSEAARRGKVLLFSRFRATPKAVAAALSHEARAQAARHDKLATEGSSLPLDTERMPVFALFYPSLWLASITDPLDGAGKGVGEVRRVVRQQLTAACRAAGIRVKQRLPRRSLWSVLASLEVQVGGYGAECLYGTEVSNDVLAEWEVAGNKRIGEVSRRELGDLVNLAVGAPGVLLARSLMRHYGAEAVQSAHEPLAALSLFPWRTYFDKPVFVNTLRGRRGSYTAALPQAALEGNLEAVLDEHFWFLAQASQQTLGDAIAQTQDALGIVGGRVRFHDPNSSKVLFQAPSDVGLPLSREIETADSRRLRTDQIRKAFNTPFWPFVLTTTSVGQEGLDFHPWCQTLVHWDLPSNPVDLEQREGRIQRYAGLAVRRAMASEYRKQVLKSRASGDSVWVRIAAVVDDEEDVSEAGLAPWWHFRDARIRSLFFHLPESDEIYQLEQLKRFRAIYRLALGQQHQEDFVRIIGTKHRDEIAKLSTLTPNLSAWYRRQVGNP